MDILIIGLGSMGKRRLRLLMKYMGRNNCSDWTIGGVDSLQSRRDEAENLFGIFTYESIQEALSKKCFDTAVVSTSPLSHAKIIEECLSNDMHVFSEINLVTDGYEKNMAAAEEKKKVLFLSSTFLYRKEMEFIKRYVSKGFRGEYQYRLGQYLPEWHPWENYKDFFVHDIRTNGCREMFAIELPWIVDVFGEVVRVHSFHKKASSLSIPYDDCYTVILEHESGIIGNISVDIITPRAGREFALWGERQYVEWKGTPDSLFEWDVEKKELVQIKLYDSYEHDENYTASIVEDAYYEELVNYIDVIQGKDIPKTTFENDARILALIDKIEGKQ